MDHPIGVRAATVLRDVCPCDACRLRPHIDSRRVLAAGEGQGIIAHLTNLPGARGYLSGYRPRSRRRSLQKAAVMFQFFESGPRHFHRTSDRWRCRETVAKVAITS